MALSKEQRDQANEKAVKLGFFDLDEFAEKCSIGSHCLHYGSPGNLTNKQFQVLADLELHLQKIAPKPAERATERQVQYLLNLGDTLPYAKLLELSKREASARIDSLTGSRGSEAARARAAGRSHGVNGEVWD